MGTEIERKFLVTGSAWRSPKPTYFCQGYLNRDMHRTVRVRIAGNSAVLTIKGLTTGARRPEFEYSIPIDDAKELLAICDGPIIEKHRHFIEHCDLTWEVDEFLGDNKGLVIAEVELDSEDQVIHMPTWVGTEVTDDSRYFNSNLAMNPYNSWTKEDT
jgi:adenylate cyclase